MPAVWARRPDARVTIVGKDPSREVQSLSADPRVRVTGTVDHLPPYLQRAAIAVAPIAYGAGIQNKVLEAMACGTPVVASAQAIRALEARPGDDLLAAETSAEFSQAILRLLEDAGERQRLGQAGRRYVETYHRWSTAAGQLEKLYCSR
jgi:glycosyltransferase involved in cell wall biosynthesis